MEKFNVGDTVCWKANSPVEGLYFNNPGAYQILKMQVKRQLITKITSNLGIVDDMTWTVSLFKLVCKAKDLSKLEKLIYKL